MKLSIQWRRVGIVLMMSIGLSVSSTRQNTPNTFPHVTEYLTESDTYMMGVEHRICLPGVWGLGLTTTVYTPFRAQFTGGLGYGWVIGEHKQEFDKKFRGWMDFKAGFELLKLKGKSSGKWVMSQTHIGDKINETYYQIDVPVVRKLVIEAGYSRNPTTGTIYPVGSGSVTSFSYNAPTFTFGLKFSSRIHANVRVKDSQSGVVHAGTVQRLFEMSVGLVLPAKKAIDSPNTEWEGIDATQEMGYSLVSKIAPKLNSLGTFDIGIKSLGYGSQAQLHVGNTFLF